MKRQENKRNKVNKRFNKIVNLRAFLRAYFNSKTGKYVLNKTYGKNPKHTPSSMAHAFMEAL